MEQFFVDDLCALKSNPSIKGTVSHTWRDLDQEPLAGIRLCYIHRKIPKKLRRDFVNYHLPPKGYVVLSFMEPYDRYCLVSESSLKLIDRNLALGDVVKRQSSDASSGMVISTSLWCTLQPSFTGLQDVEPSVKLDQEKAAEEEPLCVPAQEIKYWKEFREEDYIIYQGWVGVVSDIYDEVTVRLSNGSVVVVEEPEELEEIIFAPGTKSERHKKLLEAAGYLQHRPHSANIENKIAWGASPCYPGQSVITKKGNLRRGRWIFGAYDPAIEPKGTVVAVRPIQLEVSWAFPNVLKQDPQNMRNVPPTLLDTDILQSGKVQIYDHNRVPRNPAVPTLPNACHCPDNRFGLRVRFKDEAGAAVKYDGSTTVSGSVDSTQDGTFQDWPFQDTPTMGRYHRIPRTETQGYDMNILQISGTRTKAMIQWQDGTVTVEDSTSVVPYLNVDDHDLWLGELVSLKDAEETATGTAHDGSIHAHRVGVVQSTNSQERIAKVRWFEDPDVFIFQGADSVLLSDSTTGEISDEISEVSLYDVVAYPALTKRRGDIVLIVPQIMDAPMVAQSPSMTQALVDSIRNEYAPPEGGMVMMPREMEYIVRGLQNRVTGSTMGLQDEPDSYSSERINWFGEVVGLDLDGQLVVRLGALSEPRDVKVSVERVIVVASGDDMSVAESEDDEGDTASSDEDVAMSDVSQDSTEAIETVIEYEGGNRRDVDHDDEMWTTDDEDTPLVDAPVPNTDPDDPSNTADDDTEVPPEPRGNPDLSPHLTSGWHSIGTEIRLSSYTSMPPPFLVLNDPSPTDHHYFSSQTSLSAPLMRRITKEHKILSSSLPDGIFVRTWDTRLDLLRVLIVGARNTPYELAPFVMDFHFGDDFPKVPPDAFFHSWTGGVGRINPNLYEDGKICLSLLGTWPGDEQNESWSPQGSSMLQIIVSLFGLVLVKEPYYNEAGFSILHGIPDTLLPSALYTEKAFVMSKTFIKHALSSPPSGFSDIIKWLYSPSRPGPVLLRTVINECEALLPENQGLPGNQSTMEDTIEVQGSNKQKSASPAIRLSSGALVLLRRNLHWLKEYMDRVEETMQEAAMIE